MGRITACPAVGAPHKPPRVMRRSEQALYRSACQLGAALGLPLWAYWPILQPWVPCPHGLSGLIPFIGPRFTSLIGFPLTGLGERGHEGGAPRMPGEGERTNLAGSVVSRSIVICGVHALGQSARGRLCGASPPPAAPAHALCSCGARGDGARERKLASCSGGDTYVAVLAFVGHDV